jgi:iron complex outermembrane receptor protein
MLETEYNSERYSTSDGMFKARAYGLLNLRTNVALNQSLSLQAAVENIFDRNYEIMEGYPESGRSGVLSMACTF